MLAERAGGGALGLDCRELSGLSALEEESVLLCRRFRLAERARARRALYALSGVLDSPSLPSSEVFCDLRGERGRSGRIGRPTACKRVATHIELALRNARSTVGHRN